MENLNYYLSAARLNLLAISRTAKDGTIDVSAAGGDIPGLCKENLSLFNTHQFNFLKSNHKVEALDIDNLKNLSKEEIKRIVIGNFDKSIEYVYTLSENKQPFKKIQEIKKFIETVAKKLGEGLIKPNKWFRQHDSDKLPYTKVANLKAAFDDFCQQLFEFINSIPEDKNEQLMWTRKVAAWVEYRINLTDHFISDSCGKTSAVVSAFIFMLAKQQLPVFIDKKDYFNKTAIPKSIRTEKHKDKDTQFLTWYHYYIKKFSDYEIKDEYNELTIDKSDYVRAAIDNMLVISKTLSNQSISTTAYQTKANLVQKYNNATKAVIVANFSNVIENLYDRKDSLFPNADILRQFIYGIVYRINLGLVKNFEKTEEIKLRDSDSTHYPYTSSKDLKNAFEDFITAFHAKLTAKDDNPKQTAAWIEYEICFHHHFFPDGNKRIAIALSTFYLMRYRHTLPLIKKLEDWEKAAPNTIIDKLDNLEDSIQFQRWYVNYKNLFKQPLHFSLPSIKQQDDPWRISVDDVVYLSGTIYQYITRTREEIRDLREATGLEVKELVVFNPERIALHECIVQASVSLDLSNNEVLKKLLSENGFYGKYVLPEIKFLKESSSLLKTNFENYIGRMLESYLPGIGSKDDQIKKHIEYYQNKIEERIEKNLYNSRVSEINYVLKSLIADKLLREHFYAEIRRIVQELLSKYVNENKLKLLPLYKNFERITWAVVGGPAAGKSSLKGEVDRVINLNKSKQNISFCTVNPDLYKLYLTDSSKEENSQYFAALTHEESSYIADQLISRLWEMVKVNKAPHILLDVVKSSENKMSLARFGGAVVNLYVASCPVEGKNGAVIRAFDRANKKAGDDYRRYVPTYEILNGHKQESLLLPETIRQSLISLRLFNTNSLTPLLSAVIDDYSKHLKIYDPVGFFEFLKKSLIQSKANHSDSIYETNLDAEQLIRLIMQYQINDIALSFRYSENIPNPTITNLKNKKKALLKNNKTFFSIIEKEKHAEKLEKNKYLRALHKKEDSYAIFTQEQGFICQNIDVFSKILLALNIQLVDFIDELIDYEDSIHPNGVSITLYDSNTHLKLFEYHSKQQIFNYNIEQLQETLPQLIARRRLSAGPVDNNIFDLLSKFSNDKATELCTRAVFQPFLSDKKKINYLTKAIELSPKHDEAYKQRAILYANDYRHMDKALLDINQAIFYAPNNLELYMIQGKIYVSMLKLDLAIEAYSTAIDLAPNDINLYSGRAKIYLRAGKYKEAIDDHDKIISLMPKSFWYVERSKVFYTLGLVQRAVEDCDIALKLLSERERSDVYRLRSRYNGELQKYNEAIEDLTKAIYSAQTNIHLVYYERAISYLKLNKFNESLLDFNKAIEIQPYQYYIHLKRACVKAAIGQGENALQEIIEIKRLASTNINLQFSCATTYMDIGAMSEAINELKQIIRTNPGIWQVYHNLAIALKMNKQSNDAKYAYEQALKIYDNLIEQYPNNADLYYYRGILHFVFIKNSDAIKDFNNAIEILPYDKKSYLNLIEIYTKLSQEVPSQKQYYLDEANKIKIKYQEISENIGLIPEPIISTYLNEPNQMLTELVDKKDPLNLLQPFNLNKSVDDLSSESNLLMNKNVMQETSIDNNMPEQVYSVTESITLKL